jgi:hypothetical protein
MSKIVDISVTVDISPCEFSFGIFYTTENGEKYEQSQLNIELRSDKELPQVFNYGWRY